MRASLLIAAITLIPAIAQAQIAGTPGSLTCHYPPNPQPTTLPICGYYNGYPPAVQAQLDKIMQRKIDALHANGPGSWHSAVGVLHSHGSPWNNEADSGRPFPLNHYNMDFYNGSTGADESSSY